MQKTAAQIADHVLIQMNKNAGIREIVAKVIRKVKPAKLPKEGWTETVTSRPVSLEEMRIIAPEALRNAEKGVTAFGKRVS